MSKKTGNGDVLRCSFCNKSQRDVKKLIAGPTVYICDECVDICLDIIAEDRVLETQAPETKLPKPKEIKEFLDGYVIGQARIAELTDRIERLTALRDGLLRKMPWLIEELAAS